MTTTRSTLDELREFFGVIRQVASPLASSMAIVISNAERSGPAERRGAAAIFVPILEEMTAALESVTTPLRTAATRLTELAAEAEGAPDESRTEDHSRGRSTPTRRTREKRDVSKPRVTH